MAQPWQKHVRIRTPEGIVFPLEIADPVSRFLALLIDMLCIQVLTGLVTTVLAALGWVNPDIVGALVAVLGFTIAFGYPMVLEWFWQGRTIGKRLLRLQVMDVHGLRLRPEQVVLRNVLRSVDALPAFYMIGGLSAFLNRRGQRLGDLAANTIVIRHARVFEPDVDQVFAGKYNSFRECPHLAARLRQAVSSSERSLAMRALIRRDGLDDDARVRLFAGLREHFERVVRFPEAAVLGVSDEQYMRNVVDILMR